MRRSSCCICFLILICASLQARNLPSSVDNSVSRYFPPVIDQKGGSCAQAAHIGYMFTYEVNRLLDRSAGIPENRFSYLYTWNLLNGGHDEGTFGLEGISLALMNGVVSEADFPLQYSATNFYWVSGYDKYYRAMHYQSEGFVHIDASTREGIDAARNYLYDKNEPGSPGGVLTFSSKATGWKFIEYKGPSETGYACLQTSLASDGSHALTIVGYDDTVEFKAPDGSLSNGAFIVINSWGEYYHDRGRFYLPYWFFLQPDRKNGDLSADLQGIIVSYNKPSIVFRVGLDYSSRDDLAFRFGVSSDGEASSPKYDYAVPVMDHQGGDYPMQGRYADSGIELGINFSQYVRRVEEFDNPCYWFCVSRHKRGREEGAGKLTSLSVYDYRGGGKPDVYSLEEVPDSPFNKGENWYVIYTKKPVRTSYSLIRWLSPDTSQPVPAALVFRTADGKYAKVRFTGYDKSTGRLKMKYVYAPDGTRKLK